jgi:hypothetical protein
MKREGGRDSGGWLLLKDAFGPLRSMSDSLPASSGLRHRRIWEAVDKAVHNHYPLFSKTGADHLSFNKNFGP